MRCDNGGVMMRLIGILMLVAASAGADSWTTGTIVYDGSGNIKTMGTDWFVYDKAGRLVKGTADQQRSGGTNRQEYGYDLFGNRLSRTTIGGDCVGGCLGTATFTIEPSTNQITDHGASYDAAGNLVAVDGSTYHYDGAGMMSDQVGPGSSIDWRYIYTADDERIATFTGNGNWQFTVRDLDGKVLREINAAPVGGSTTWTWTRDHIFRDGLLLATVSPSGQEQFHLDHLGTARVVTDANDTLKGMHAYYPFGDELNLTPKESPWERLKFTGHERDEAAGAAALDYMHARYYSPLQARFLSPDPTVDLENARYSPQRWNRYTYVQNNPLSRIDTDGRYDAMFTGLADSTAMRNAGMSERAIQTALVRRGKAGTVGALIGMTLAITAPLVPGAAEVVVSTCFANGPRCAQIINTVGSALSPLGESPNPEAIGAEIATQLPKPGGGMMAKLVELVTARGLSQENAAAAAVAAIKGKNMWAGVVRVGSDLVLTSRAQGMSQEVLIVDKSGRLVKGFADIAYDRFGNAIVSNVERVAH
jgi:RHS repeat-associated protein